MQMTVDQGVVTSKGRATAEDDSQLNTISVRQE